MLRKWHAKHVISRYALAKYTSGKSPWLYLPAAAFLTYLYYIVVTWQGAMQNKNPILSLMYIIEFGIHEGSHLFTSLFLPHFWVVAAGSTGEIAFTILVALVFMVTRHYFVAIFGLLWIDLSCNSVGRYMADAQAQRIPLLDFGQHPMHDWHYLFSATGLLSYCTTIGTTVRIIGDVIGFLSVMFGFYLIWMMYKNRNATPAADLATELSHMSLNGLREDPKDLL